jgi:hypothetical protein
MASDPLNPESLPGAQYHGSLSSDSSLDATDWSFRWRLKKREISPREYTGQGEDDAPRSPKKKTHKKSGSMRLNGYSKPKGPDASDLIVEDFQDKNGARLTTLKRADTELVSGRRAGAGWERSQ